MTRANEDPRNVRLIPGQELPPSQRNKPAQATDLSGNFIFNARYGVQPPEKRRKGMRYENARDIVRGLVLDHVDEFEHDTGNGKVLVQHHCSVGVLLPCVDRYQVGLLKHALADWAANEHADNNTDWWLELVRDDDHVGLFVRKVSIFALEREPDHANG